VQRSHVCVLGQTHSKKKKEKKKKKKTYEPLLQWPHVVSKGAGIHKEDDDEDSKHSLIYIDTTTVHIC